ncbi:MAG TPA: cohesin domain-containing protein [Patescibacteria group bacterium]
MKKILVFLFLLLFGQRASAAMLYSQSANQDVYEGQTFVVDWFLDTEGRPVNSFDLKLNFSSDVLEATDASRGNSLINLWIKSPTADNQKGLIELTGGIANGANNNKIPVFHSVFRAKKTGIAFIKLNPTSIILLNDGRGTSEQLKFKDELFNVYPKAYIPVAISSPTHPDQNVWYSNRNVEIKFTPKAATDYSFSFSSNADMIPEDKKAEIPKNLSYHDLPDGIYYFKLNSKVGPSVWKEAGVFRTQIDTIPPESFRPLIASSPAVFGGRAFVSFSTVDKTSGISHYKVKVGLFRDSIETKSPYQLRKPWVGDNIMITAYDKAGNSTTVTIPWRGYLSVLQFKLLLVFLGLSALVVNWIIRKRLMKLKVK